MNSPSLLCCLLSFLIAMPYHCFYGWLYVLMPCPYYHIIWLSFFSYSNALSPCPYYRIPFILTRNINFSKISKKKGYLKKKKVTFPKIQRKLQKTETKDLQKAFQQFREEKKLKKKSKFYTYRYLIIK